jgi:hypothetical protein
MTSGQLIPEQKPALNECLPTSDERAFREAGHADDEPGR